MSSETKRKHVEMSNRLSEMHDEHGVGAVLHETGEPVSAAAVELDPDIARVEGRSLRPRKDVRAFMYRVPQEIKERPGTVVWCGYDDEEDATYLGTACVRDEDELPDEGDE